MQNRCFRQSGLFAMNLSRPTSCLSFRASNRPLAPLIAQTRCRRSALHASKRPEHAGEQSLWPKLKSVAVSIAGAAIVLSPSNGYAADMVQTVPASQMMQIAKPLPKQQVDKGRIWGVFIGGAAFLFLGTLALENNPSFFPAISKANQASADAKQAAQAAERAASVQDATATEVLRQTALVEQGLLEAKQRVLSQPSTSPSQEPEVQEPAVSSHRAEAAAEDGSQVNSTPEAAESEASSAKQARLANFVNGITADGRQGLSSLKDPSRQDTVKTL